MRYFLLCCLFFTASAFAEIRTIQSLDEISTDELSPKTLVMFNLFDVLIYPKDRLLQHWRSGWKPEGSRSWTAEEDTLAWMYAKFQLLDSSGPNLINLLNEKGIPTIGFTSFAMDDPTIVKSIPDWLSPHLQELGFNFINDNGVVFLIESGFVQPSFEKGVLYCGNIYKKDKDNKGKILSLYLDWLDWTPDQIVFVEDNQRHLEAVKKQLERRGIAFEGYLYLPKDFDPIDETIAELQYQTMINQKEWLSDEEVKKRRK